MAAVNLPDNPANGTTQTVGGITYTYNSSKGYWTAAASSGGGGGGGASVTTDDTAPSSPSDGDLWWDSDGGKMYVYYEDTDSSQWVSVSVPGSTGPAGAAGAAGADATPTSYTNLAAFPSSGNTLGDFAIAQDTKALYVWDGTEWDRIAAGSDESPRVTTEPATSHDLNSDGTTSTLTMVAEDPEGFNIEYGIKYNTSGGTLPSQLASATTINQSTGVFTFTPTTTESNAGSFNARLTASDGNRVTVRTIPFNLSFGLADVYGFRFVQTSNSYNHTVFNTVILSGDGSIHDETGFGTEASWSPTPSWGNDVDAAVTNTTGYYGKFFVDEALATFGITLSSFNNAYVSESTANDTFDLKWTTARTIKGILISGDATNGFDYWTTGYVQAYIGGNTASDLVSTQYTFVNNTVSAAAVSKFYDFR